MKELKLIALITMLVLIIASYIKGGNDMSDGKDELKQPDPREANTITLFNAIQENIKFIKRQQWQLVYYTLLLYGALFYVDNNSNICPWVFGFLTWLISIGSFMLLCKFICDLRKERRVIAPLRKLCFTEKALKKLYPDDKSIDAGIARESKKLDWLYLLLFGLLFLFASLVLPSLSRSWVIIFALGYLTISFGYECYKFRIPKNNVAE